MTKAHPVENDVKDKIKDLLDAHGWKHWPAAASKFGVGGISDRCAIRRCGVGCIFMAVEAKLDKATGSERQEEFLKDIRDQGGIGIVVNRHNLDKFEALLVAISRAYPLVPPAGLPHVNGDFGWSTKP